MEDEDLRAFTTIERRMSTPRDISPLPQLTKKTDGFSRNDVVASFQRAFEMIGGVQRMALWADANPDKFFPLYSRLLPSTAIQIGNATNIVIQHAIPPSDLDKHPEQEAEVADASSGE